MIIKHLKNKIKNKNLIHTPYLDTKTFTIILI